MLLSVYHFEFGIFSMVSCPLYRVYISSSFVGVCVCRGECASSASTTRNVRRCCRIRDRRRLQRCGCLLSLGKGMFAGVVGNARDNDLCRGVDCRFSYEYIGEKSRVVGYCIWCDRDTMLKAMESNFLRNCHVQ